MSDLTTNINTLNLKELQELLKELRLFSSLKKQLWNRWKILYTELKTGKKTFEVEYFSKISEDVVWEEAKKVFEKIFKETPEKKDVIFIPKDKLEWWIKVYVGNNVLDLSYERIKKVLKK
jgi:hypothetical protein